MEQTLAPGTGLLTCALLAKILDELDQPPSRNHLVPVAFRLAFSRIAQLPDAGTRAYSCGAVADFHRLPEHPSAVHSTQARWRNAFRRALAP